MKFELKTSELKEFVNKSKVVKTSSIQPILSYIKYEDGVLTKTNMETYFSSKISTKTKGSFLIDENILTAKLKEVTGDTISFDIDGKIAKIGKLKFPIEDVSGFPKAPETEDADKITLDSSIVSSIGFFRHLAMTSEHSTAFCYVHLSESGMYVTNNSSFANREFFASLPDILLSIEACALLSTYNEVDFYTKDNYYFFISPKDTIAFIKPEHKSPIDSFKRVMGGCTKEKYFEFEKKDFLSFCDFVNAVAPSELPDCTIEVKNRKMVLNLNDSISDSREFDVVGPHEIEPFTFNPKIFAAYLKAIPYSILRISPHSQNGVLTLWTIEDEQFNGILVGLIPKPQN